ncbi:glycosyltransferase [Acidimicrobiaceae bacterium USS-CC1]|uniref:Glycosyltransferase n=1 Tax=Acidiferrimicrobium australe TaxID=2664430 RepID=A0ABW9QQS0_9ACTN|nr:glycosyltransferase [Acidiferrimicrobium australe]
MADVSVVIALYNGAATIGEQLDALASQTLSGCEIVVADNGSTDGGPEIVRSHRVGARLVDASQRRGQGYARNAGASAATGSKLLFCDSDDVVDTGWAAALADALDRWDVVGGFLEERTLNEGIEGWRNPSSAIFTARPLPYGGGGNLGIRRHVFEAISGWPTDLTGSGEDNVLCWRAQLAGYSFGHEPSAIVHYRWRHDLSAHVRQQFVYGRQLPIVQARFPQFEPARVTPWWKTLGWLGTHTPLLFRRRTVGLWLGTAAYRLGMAAGARVSDQMRVRSDPDSGPA